jgi:hypothetical protein
MHFGNPFPLGTQILAILVTLACSLGVTFMLRKALTSIGLRVSVRREPKSLKLAIYSQGAYHLETTHINRSADERFSGTNTQLQSKIAHVRLIPLGPAQQPPADQYQEEVNRSVTLGVTREEERIAQLEVENREQRIARLEVENCKLRQQLKVANDELLQRLQTETAKLRQQLETANAEERIKQLEAANSKLRQQLRQS